MGLAASPGTTKLTYCFTVHFTRDRWAGRAILLDSDVGLQDATGKGHGFACPASEVMDLKSSLGVVHHHLAYHDQVTRFIQLLFRRGIMCLFLDLGIEREASARSAAETILVTGTRSRHIWRFVA